MPGRYIQIVLQNYTYLTVGDVIDHNNDWWKITAITKGDDNFPGLVKLALQRPTIVYRDNDPEEEARFLMRVKTVTAPEFELARVQF